jgi:leader peptidase (prepilin peptidase)/N-methyltransferase
LLFVAAWVLGHGLLLPLTLLSLLLTAARTDSACGIIPDELVLSSILIGLGFGLAGWVWGPAERVILPHLPLHPLITAIAGGLFASASLLWLGVIFEFFTDREGFGLGDVKLAGVLGVFLGWSGALWVLFYAAWIAILCEFCRWIFLRRFRGRRPFPLAPYVLLGTLLYVALYLLRRAQNGI